MIRSIVTLGLTIDAIENLDCALNCFILPYFCGVSIVMSKSLDLPYWILPNKYAYSPGIMVGHSIHFV